MNLLCKEGYHWQCYIVQSPSHSPRLFTGTWHQTFDTFALIAKLVSIWSVPALAADDDLELHQIDIKRAYLNGELTNHEVIYMQQSPGYYTSNSSHFICQLCKTLYCLKQSGQCWYQKLVDIMITHLGFQQCNVNQAVFFHGEECTIIIVLVHIDDCPVAATSIMLIAEFKIQITKHVQIINLDELQWLLGIKIKHNHKHHTLHLSVLLPQLNYSAIWIQRPQIHFHPNGHHYPILYHTVPINYCQHHKDMQYSLPQSCQLTHVCSTQNMPGHCFCCPNCFSLLKELQTHLLESCQTNFLLLEGYHGLVAYLWKE